MHIKTVKPHIMSDNDSDIAMIMSYIENLKEEISFLIESLSKKIDLIKSNLENSGGDSQ